MSDAGTARLPTCLCFMFAKRETPRRLAQRATQCMLIFWTLSTGNIPTYTPLFFPKVITSPQVLKRTLMLDRV